MQEYFGWWKESMGETGIKPIVIEENMILPKV